MTVSGVLLTTMATALVGSGAAAAPVPSTTSPPASAQLAAWSALAPPSLHRVVNRPTPGKIAAKAAPKPGSPKSVAGSVQADPGQRTSRAVPAVRHTVRADRRSPLQRAVARIPGYRQHRPAHWVLTTKHGHYGVTDWYHNTVYISPRVPAPQLDDVVRHEWGHILSVRAYGGSVASTVAGLNRTFGGSGLTGAERAADCVATMLGASWRHYTSCSSRTWQRQAAALLAGRRP